LSATSQRKRVTRADVARLADVSTAVVSYVLNDGPGTVAPSTRARVLHAVDALGYRPNASARALATGASHLLGLVVPDISNPLFAELALSIEAAAKTRGYAVLLANTEDDERVERQQIANLVDRGVDGILLSSVRSAPDFSATGSTRIVLLNASGEHPDAAAIGPNAFEGARIATNHLIDHGHTQIGLIIGRTNSASIEPREAGWLQALEDRGLNPGPIARDEFSREGGYRAAHRLFDTPHRPRAIFASSDLQAAGTLAALHKLGQRVPEDAAVISFDGTAESRFSVPPLTTVRQPISEMASRVIELATSQQPSKYLYESFAPELIIRDSCGCP
jgi:LacI family transcriptional regulator